MQIKTVNTDDIRYNPATNAFEASVTIKSTDMTYQYPCAIEGSLMMPLATAAFKLTQQAKQRHKDKNALRTRCKTQGFARAAQGHSPQDTLLRAA